MPASRRSRCAPRIGHDPPGPLAATGIRPGQPRAAALTAACLARRVAEPGEIATREAIAGCGCWPVIKVIGEAGRVKCRPAVQARGDLVSATGAPPALVLCGHAAGGWLAMGHRENPAASCSAKPYSHPPAL